MTKVHLCTERTCQHTVSNSPEILKDASVAIRVVAAMVAANAVAGVSTPEWENYPEVGEHDWAKVRTEVDRLVVKLAPDMDAYLAAYDALAARADNTEAW